jgi:hypothetical protein
LFETFLFALTTILLLCNEGSPAADVLATASPLKEEVCGPARKEDLEATELEAILEAAILTEECVLLSRLAVSAETLEGEVGKDRSQTLKMKFKLEASCDKF